jgi:hypothetical protein
VSRQDALRAVGVITRSDLLAAHARRLRELDEIERVASRME